MQINNLGANITELIKPSGDVILFSYYTPVAAKIDAEYYKTSYRWGVTTSKHINQWLRKLSPIAISKVIEKPQEFFDGLN
jgi:hypothetical protein